MMKIRNEELQELSPKEISTIYGGDTVEDVGYAIGWWAGAVVGTFFNALDKATNLL